jgi:hypothetical protein
MADMKTCFLCKNDAEFLATGRTLWDVACPNCGRYQLTWLAQAVTKTFTDDQWNRLSEHVKFASGRKHVLELNSENVFQLSTTSPGRLVERLTGEGDLLFSDHTLFGRVNYRVICDHGSPTRLGTITGQFTPLNASDRHFPFWDFSLRDHVGLLKLADGRWWICNVQVDGDASNRGGLHVGTEPPSHW